MARGDNLIQHQWKPGRAPYAEWLKTLTPEERAAHLKERAQKKAIKKAVQTVVQEHQARWVANLHTAAWRQLMKARDAGDTQAFIAIWDRIVGRPDTTIVDDTGRILPWSDDSDNNTTDQ